MARIAGVDLPKKKRIEYGLTYIFGIGLHTSRGILETVGLSPDKRVHELSEDDVAGITKAIRESGFLVEGDLRKKSSDGYKRSYGHRYISWYTSPSWITGTWTNLRQMRVLVRVNVKLSAQQRREENYG